MVPMPAAVHLEPERYHVDHAELRSPGHDRRPTAPAQRRDGGGEQGLGTGRVDDGVRTTTSGERPDLLLAGTGAGIDDDGASARGEVLAVRIDLDRDDRAPRRPR